MGAPEEGLDVILRSIAPEETASQFRISADSSRQQTSAVNQRLSLLKQGVSRFSFNGISLSGEPSGGAAGDEAGAPGRLGLFASFQSDGADRDTTANETGYEQSGLALTAGADYAYSPKLFVGLAVGLTSSDLDYNERGGTLETDILSFIGFTTWYHQQFSIDLQIGYGAIDYDSRRRIQYVDATGEVDTLATSNTEGGQFILNGQLQYDWYRDALSLSPYLRLDYVASDIDAYGENNAGGLEVEIQDQSFSRLTFTAGVQGSYALNQDWGVLLPTFQSSVLNDTAIDQEDVVGRFAFDPDQSNTFTLIQDEEDALYFQLGVGVIALFPQGFSVFAEYLQTLAYDNVAIYQIQAGFRYEL